MLITTTCDLGNWPPNTWNRVNKLQHLHFDKAIKRRGKEKFKDVTHDYQKKNLPKLTVTIGQQTGATFCVNS